METPLHVTLLNCLTMKSKALRSFQTMVTVVQLTCGNNPEDLMKCYILFVHNMYLRVFMTSIIIIIIIPLALQPGVSFGLSNNVLPFFSICH